MRSSVNEPTSWRTPRHVAVFPSNTWVNSITPRSIWGTTIRIATRVGVFSTNYKIFRYAPVSMWALCGTRLTSTTRPCSVYVTSIPNADAIVTICRLLTIINRYVKSYCLYLCTLNYQVEVEVWASNANFPLVCILALYRLPS